MDNVALQLGPLLAGCCVDVLLQGILSVQFTTYFEHYCDDRLFLKLAVAGLVLFTTLKSCQSFGMLWVELIDAFGDLELAFITYGGHWTIRMNAITVAALGSYVRAYFCYRLYSISEVRWTVALVASTDVLAFILISASYYQAFSRPESVHRDETVLLYFALHFSIVFVGDMLLTLLTAFFLIRSKKEVLPRSYGIINALIRLTFETAAPSAICSLINLTVSQIPGYYPFLAASNEVLPKLYAVSMMWTLNARQELRGLPWGNRSTLSYISSGKKNTRELVQAKTIHREEFELRQLSNAIQTQKDTHVEVRRHLDVRSANLPESQEPDAIATRRRRSQPNYGSINLVHKPV